MSALLDRAVAVEREHALLPREALGLGSFLARYGPLPPVDDGDLVGDRPGGAPARMKAYVDRYCADHPLDDIAKAAQTLVVALEAAH